MKKSYKKIDLSGIAKPNLCYPLNFCLRRSLLLFILCLLITISCRCPYGFKVNSLPAHLKTVAIPTFENNTFEYGIEEDFTQVLIDEVENDGNLKIKTDMEEVDSVLEGKVTGYKKTKSSYDDDGVVKEYKVSVTVSWEFTDKVENTVYAESSDKGDEIYLVPDEGDSEDLENEAKEEAIHKLAEAIVTKIVQNW